MPQLSDFIQQQATSLLDFNIIVSVSAVTIMSHMERWTDWSATDPAVETQSRCAVDSGGTQYTRLKLARGVLSLRGWKNV